MSARSIPLSENEPVNELKGSARPIEVSDKDISRFRSLVSAPIKGLAKTSVGLVRLGALLMDPTDVFLTKDIFPLLNKADEKIEKNIPTHPEFLEKALERGAGPAVIGAILGGVIPAVLGLASGFGGQAVEEAGGGPLAQAAVEFGISGIPSWSRRIVPSNADQQRILNFGRNRGMTEEQLAPLMPEGGKRRFFGRFAFASENSADQLGQTRRGIQDIYTTIENDFANHPPLSQNASNQFIRDTGAIMHRLSANVRNQVAQDAQELFQAAQQRGGFTGDELINWYRDISSRYNLGRAELELLKNPIRDALHSINPQLAAEFSIANRMYQKSAQIGRVLRPNEYEHLISLGEAYELGAGIATLDMSRIERILGLAGFRKFSEKCSLVLDFKIL